MKTKLLSLIVSFVMYSLTTAPASAVQTGCYDVELDTTGGAFTLALYIPESYDGTTACPIATAFHGGGMAATNMRDLVYLADRSIGALVYCFDFNDISSLEVFHARLSKSILYMKSNFLIDKSKSFAVCFSAGAYYAYNLALSNPGLFTGIIALSPALKTSHIPTAFWPNMKNVRFATITGTADEFYPGVDSLIQVIIQNGGPVKYIVKQGMGHGDNNYINSQEYIDDFQVCYDFIFADPSEIVSNPENNLSVEIGPNPASDYILIGMATGNAPVKLTIASQEGSPVYMSDFAGQDTIREKIDLSSLANGVYFVTVKAGSRVYTGKFIKCE